MKDIPILNIGICLKNYLHCHFKRSIEENLFYLVSLVNCKCCDHTTVYLNYWTTCWTLLNKTSHKEWKGYLIYIFKNLFDLLNNKDTTTMYIYTVYSIYVYSICVGMSIPPLSLHPPPSHTCGNRCAYNWTPHTPNCLFLSTIPTSSI